MIIVALDISVAFFFLTIAQHDPRGAAEASPQEEKDLEAAPESLPDPCRESGVRDVRGGGTQQPQRSEKHDCAVPLVELSAGGPWSAPGSQLPLRIAQRHGR